LIAASRAKAVHAVNTALIEFYWQIGSMLSRKIEAAEWREGVVERLAEFIAWVESSMFFCPYFILSIELCRISFCCTSGDRALRFCKWLRVLDLNQRPLGYE
jgi:hypothetical protein